MGQARVIERLRDEVVRLDWSFGFQWDGRSERGRRAAQPLV
jgi:hypothetical protein